MGLPKITQPLFDVVLPSTKKKLTMRPFVVREEKLMLMAQQSGDKTDVIKSIKQVINNCIVKPDPFDVDDLTTFDMEYLFIKLRCESVNRIVELKYRDQDDDQIYDVTVDLSQVEIVNKPGHTNKIKITEEIGLTLRYPKVDMMEHIKDVDNETDLLMGIVRYCIDMIYDGDEIYKAKDFTDEEVDEFINQLTVETFGDIRKFFDTLPSLYYKAGYTNKAGVERVIELKTLEDFFMLG